MRADLDPLGQSDPVAAILAEHARPAAERRVLALHTSGTSTGVPRVVRRSTASWVDSFAAFSDLSGTTPASRVWIPGPLASTMNLFAATHAAHLGASLVSDPHLATHLHLTPAALDALVRQDPAALADRTVVTAGMGLSPQQADAAHAVGARVHHYYGAAELSFIAWGRHSADLYAFPGVEVSSRSGALVARSPYLSLSAVPDPDGWCTVGDLGRVTAAGRVVVHGRPGTITTAGATVQISEIEATLRDLAPHGIVVLGDPHPRLGEVVTAYLTDADQLPALKARARERLTPAARPRQWRVVAGWPLGEHGKIDRSALATAAWSAPLDEPLEPT